MKDISKVDTFNEAMAEAGYESKGKNGITGRRFFRKGDSLRTYHIHVYQL
ncbi:GrpB family protein [Domibacillus sp. DTU_2020_1001157_1_SI_ALB_TIR_016]|nr:GrpB family protein [Domibacillus sp. DTU_2020_1001157_1_SI_ALB_TIR_016]WNS78211.1 GrpB family protein [Domibacillus sp. DTU_2020_1001157_1_SI_ALB_TIR_016]